MSCFAFYLKNASSSCKSIVDDCIEQFLEMEKNSNKEK